MFYFFLHTRVLRHLFSRLVLLGCLCFLTAIYSVLLLMQLVFGLPGFFLRGASFLSILLSVV
jgi:hypothetical protein